MDGCRNNASQLEPLSMTDKHVGEKV